jgi:carbamoyl-phosphate synthase large subunit
VWVASRYPVIVKPRHAGGGRGVALVASPAELAACAAEPDLLVQDYLPGDEYSIDVLADHLGRVHACVPRVRVRGDSGASVAGYTLRDRDLERFGRLVVEVLGLPFISNVTVRRDVDGRPSLLEVNPRVPATLALTAGAGVDMASMAVDALRGRPIPAGIEHREVAVVCYLASMVVAVDAIVSSPAPVAT